jgi:hypothetical protein
MRPRRCPRRAPAAGLPGNAEASLGCPGWIRTSTVPLNRRADYCYPTGQLNAERGNRNAESRVAHPLHSAFRVPSSAFGKWSARQDLHLRSPGPKPGVLLLHHALRKARLRRATEPGLRQAGHQPWKQSRCGRWKKRGSQDAERGKLGRGSAFRVLVPALEWRTRRGLHPQPSRRQRGALP